MGTVWSGTEGGRDGHVVHFHHFCCSWSPTPGTRSPNPGKDLSGYLSPSGLLWLEETVVLPAKHTAVSQHPLLQAAVVLVFHIREGISHSYFLFQLFLPYK